MTHTYTWGNNPRRAQLKNQPCKIIAQGRKNSVLIEFANGDRVITSRYAIRANPTHTANEQLTWNFPQK
jgi:hypothetical protein